MLSIIVYWTALSFTTEDGINTTNTIVLEPDVWQALKEFAKRSIEL
jgi:uncharacterized linocin/CFP29 family protein